MTVMIRIDKLHLEGQRGGGGGGLLVLYNGIHDSHRARVGSVG